jgi:hypothetical protein
VPVPTRMGILPLHSSTATSRTDLRSDMVITEASPVVPRMQSPSVPDWRWNWRRVRSWGISMEPVGVIGVIRATKLPCLIGVCFNP